MSYKECKEKARADAINWLNTINLEDYSTMDFVIYNNYFYRIGKRYGLIKEFRENGII